jgi:hypothetical protein
MKLLQNLLHHGVTYKRGEVVELEVLEDEAHQTIVDQVNQTRNEQPVYRAPVARDLAPLQGKIAKSDLDQLIADGVVSLDNNAALPKAATTARDVKMQNLEAADEETEKWDAIKKEQAADRQGNVTAPAAPAAPSSQVVQGTPADAAAADTAA